MKGTAASYKRQQVFYGGMFLLGIIVALLYLIHLIQTMDTLPVFRMMVKVLMLLLCVLKTVDYYKEYRKHAAIKP
jgi:cobalamin biosynthesis protein CobD/CbiB